MTEQFKIGEEFQKVGKDSFDAAVRAYGEANKGFQAIVSEVTNYSKKAFEDGTRAFEQLIGAKSVEQAFEIQTDYAKKAYDNHVAQMSKLGEMYVNLAVARTSPSRKPPLGLQRRSRKASSTFFVRQQDPWAASGLFLTSGDGT